MKVDFGYNQDSAGITLRYKATTIAIHYTDSNYGYSRMTNTNGYGMIMILQSRQWFGSSKPGGQH